MGTATNSYLNYHRPCGFATVEVGDNGKRRRRSRHSPRNTALSLKRIGWLYPIFPGQQPN